MAPLFSVLIVLSLPAMVGIYIAKTGSNKSRIRVRTGLIGLAVVLLIVWPVLTFIAFMGFGIGGGNPTIFQIFSLALLATSPLPLVAVFSLFSARSLKNGLQR